MRSRIALFSFATIVALTLPVAASAGVPFFGPIIPTSYLGQPTSVCPGGLGLLMVVVNNLISLLITVAIVFVAPLMIAYAGFLFVVNPVNPSGKEKAKTVLWGTVIGIVIALVSYLLVAALMAVLYDANAKIPGTSKTLGTWSALVSTGGGDICIKLAGSLKPAVVAPPPVPTVTVVPGQTINGFATGCSTSHDQNVATLVTAGVAGYSSGNCCIKTQSTCTSLDGMLTGTLSQIVNVKNKCGSTVVAGGTEVGHASEGGTGSRSGGSKVDIAANLISCVLQNGGSAVNPPSFGSSQARDRCGNIYTWEGNHTDIYVVSTCAL